MAMMKYWDNPDVLSKLGRAMGDVMQLPEGEEGERAGTQRSAQHAMHMHRLSTLERAGAGPRGGCRHGHARMDAHLACACPVLWPLAARCAGEEEGEEEAGDDNTVHGAASAGNADKLKVRAGRACRAALLGHATHLLCCALKHSQILAL